jgi:uncharacterized coiled-coil protein SlyX
MDSIQNQVATLNTRVDALQQMIEQLSNKTSEVLSEVRSSASITEYPLSGLNSRRYASSSYSSLDTSLEHKDVLVDSNFCESDMHSGDRVISPEIQIQRLTAQLTAAYNRIAALEEQLLAQRIH